jgi:hypothetical protein
VKREYRRAVAGSSMSGREKGMQLSGNFLVANVGD